jgi:hypothetical protein
VFSYASTLGQLFPGTVLNYRIPWPGRPTPGTYRVLGTIRPQGSATIRIDQSIKLTAASVTELQRETVPSPSTPGIPVWVWIALSGAAILLIALSLAVWKLTQRPIRAAA